MSLSVALIVLAAAAMHATWNAFVKAGGDRFVEVARIFLFSGALAVPLVPFFPLPAAASLPYLAASIVLHAAYAFCLIRAYEVGDMTQVYPIARGLAPGMVALMAGPLIGEVLSLRASAGVAILVAGLWMVSVRPGRSLFSVDRGALAWALATALTVAGYTVVDGLGGRSSGSAHAYSLWLFVCDGAVMAAVFLWRRGAGALRQAVLSSGRPLIGGALSLGAYWIAIWAMTVAPIAVVATLRETSVLFGSAIAMLWLGERASAARLIGCLMILLGAILARLG